MTEEMIEDICEEIIQDEIVEENINEIVQLEKSENVEDQDNELHQSDDDNSNDIVQQTMTDDIEDQNNSLQPSGDVIVNDEINKQQLKMFVEAALLANEHPLTVEQIRHLFDEFERPAANEIRDVLTVIAQECENRGVELVEVASGFRFQIKIQFGARLGKLWEEKPPRYSRALLETLALIAYRQPITRAEIEDIRGVVVSSHIIKILLDREWIRVVGHRDVPGKPGLYATTKQFLDYFNMKSLADLPTLTEIKNLDILADQIEGKGNSELVKNDAEHDQAEIKEHLHDTDVEDESEFELENNEIDDQEQTELKEYLQDTDLEDEDDQGDAELEEHSQDTDLENEMKFELENTEESLEKEITASSSNEQSQNNEINESIIIEQMEYEQVEKDIVIEELTIEEFA